VAKERSPNWLRDRLTTHVPLSADRKRRRPAAVTSVHSSARYTGAVPARVVVVVVVVVAGSSGGRNS